MDDAENGDDMDESADDDDADASHLIDSAFRNCPIAWAANAQSNGASSASSSGQRSRILAHVASLPGAQ